ncbi:MAG: SRPBCC family protein [Acidimicrobiaceae bacterium]|nr:SRPBCC family protein [Acidimicrobiaceae bacterium]
MEIRNEFTVSVPIEQAWETLTDVEKIAPCLPGASLDGRDGESYLGQVKIKVGPITASYKGKAHFIEKDEQAHKAVLKAEGRDTKGQGNASATITAQLKEAGSGTFVEVTTDLAISGRVAQFGRGVLADVSGKLLEQFVATLESTVLGSNAPASSASSPEDTNGKATTSGASTSGSATQPRSVEPEPVDLMGLAGKTMAKRLLPAIPAVFFVILILLKRNKKNRRKRA